MSADLKTLHEEVAEIQASLAPEPPPEPPVPAEPAITPELQARLDALAVEQQTAAEQLQKLQLAVEGGLDPALMAPSIAAAEQKIADLSAQIASVRAEAEAPPPATEPEEPSAQPELPNTPCSLGLSVSSAYVFRGANVFSDGNPNRQHPLLAPSARCDLGKTGAWVAYWGGYQLGGSNAPDLVASGLGHEQDIVFGFERPFSENGPIGTVTLTAYVYPFATKAAAGTLVPTYLEPMVGIRTSGATTAGLKVGYMLGLQEAISVYRYFYLNPTIARSWSLGSDWSTALSLSLGYKAYTASDAPTANVFDAQTDWLFTKPLSSRLSVSPGVHLAGTNAPDGAALTTWISLDGAFDI